MTKEDRDTADSLTDEELDIQGRMGYAEGHPPVPQVAATPETQFLEAPDWAHNYPNYLGVLPLSQNHFIT